MGLTPKETKARNELEVMIRNIQAHCDKHDLQVIVFADASPEDVDEFEKMQAEAEDGHDISAMLHMSHCGNKFKYEAYSRMDSDPMIHIMKLILKCEHGDSHNVKDPSRAVSDMMRGIFSNEDN